MNTDLEFLKNFTLSDNEILELDGLTITGIKTTHGPLSLKIWKFDKTEHPGSEERLGWGSLGYKISIGCC
ncbi:MAG: hypothetical protein ACXAC7_16450 [Candidatus Hodarchaeales archaeon]